MNWIDVFTPPFSITGVMVFDSRDRFVMNTYVSNESTDKILDKLNGIHNKPPKNGRFSLKDGDQKIYYNNHPIFLIRGWGRLTGSGGLNLPHMEAVKLQDDFATWIVKRLNE